MAISYTLVISSLDRIKSYNELNDVIYQVNLNVTSYSEEYPELIYSCSGIVEFDISSINTTSFIEFNQVTKDTVLNWLLQKEGVPNIEKFSFVKYCIDNIEQRVQALQVKDKIGVDWSFSSNSTV